MKAQRPLDSPEDKWIEVLAGRRAADDADSRQAELVRSYFLQREQEPLTTVFDEAGETRMLNALRARGAFAPAAAPAVPRPSQEAPGQHEGVFHAVLRWIWPVDGPPGQRYAMVAGLMAAVLLAPLMVHLTDSRESGDAQSKTTQQPDASTKSLKGPSPGTQTSLQLMSDDAVRVASDMANALRGAGAQVSSQVSGSTTTLLVTTPASVRDRVAAVMAQFGLTLPQGTSAQVVIRPYP